MFEIIVKKHEGLFLAYKPVVPLFKNKVCIYTVYILGLLMSVGHTQSESTVVNGFILFVFVML